MGTMQLKMTSDFSNINQTLDALQFIREEDEYIANVMDQLEIYYTKNKHMMMTPDFEGYTSFTMRREWLRKTSQQLYKHLKQLESFEV